MYYRICFISICDFAQIKLLKEVDSLKDVTVRFGSVLLAISRVYLHETVTSHLLSINSAFQSIDIVLSLNEHSNASIVPVQDATHGKGE
jgi:hypothetical protein